MRSPNNRFDPSKSCGDSPNRFDIRYFSERRWSQTPPRTFSSADHPLEVIEAHKRNARDLIKYAEKAAEERRTFAIEGDFPILRKILLKRGWVERFVTNGQTNSKSVTEYIKEQERYYAALDSLEAMKSRVSNVRLMSCQLCAMYKKPDILWTNMRLHLKGGVLVNRFPDATFTTKVGLCKNLANVELYHEAGVSKTVFPRGYLLSRTAGVTAFVQDFQLTACFSLLKWIVDLFKKDPQLLFETREAFYSRCREVGKGFGEWPMVHYKEVTFALEQGKEYIKQCRHKDVPRPSSLVSLSPITVEENWKWFIRSYYAIVHNKSKLEYMPPKSIRYLIQKCKNVLKQVSTYCPHLSWDGTQNIWIIKPGAESCGRGIHIIKKMEDALKLVHCTPGRKTQQYVIQKYIERPLLIFNTKFDIRQWFMVTNWNPLTAWLYRDCYLRFCSRRYSVSNLHESIHLCNHYVQKNYKNENNDLLPAEKMWDCHKFQSYLKEQGHPRAWSTIISPGMQQGLVGALLSSQEHVTNRKNSFELYGADFMLTEDFQPWLLEINCNPNMSGSTSITKKMCAECFDDVMKVVVDRENNEFCNTGNFILMYQQKTEAICENKNLDQQVSGTSITKDNQPKQQNNVLSDTSSEKIYTVKNKTQETGLHPKKNQMKPQNTKASILPVSNAPAHALPLNKKSVIAKQCQSKPLKNLAPLSTQKSTETIYNFTSRPQEVCLHAKNSALNPDVKTAQESFMPLKMAPAACLPKRKLTKNLPAKIPKLAAQTVVKQDAATQKEDCKTMSDPLHSRLPIKTTSISKKAPAKNQSYAPKAPKLPPL